MGTVYTVHVPHAPARTLLGLEQAIHSRLAQVNAAMSAYSPESELSRFNALPVGVSMAVSDDFEQVMRVSWQAYTETGGAFDPTVKPLLDLWGFGPGSAPREAWHPPNEDEVNRSLAAIGMEHVDLSRPGQLGKLHPDVQLDLGAVAKGYAVDALAELLEERGVRDYLVDIGGDIRLAGRNAKGEPWRVGVNSPRRGSEWESVFLVLRPGWGAVLTSGDYRQFVEHQDQFFSHILDPRTGWSVANDVASVTVLGATAVHADALATGLMVLGVEKGLELVETLPGIEVLFLVRDVDGDFWSARSTGFDQRGGL